MKLDKFNLTPEELELINKKRPPHSWRTIKRGFDLLMRKHKELSRAHQRKSFQ